MGGEAGEEGHLFFKPAGYSGDADKVRSLHFNSANRVCKLDAIRERSQVSWCLAKDVCRLIDPAREHSYNYYTLLSVQKCK